MDGNTLSNDPAERGPLGGDVSGRNSSITCPARQFSRFDTVRIVLGSLLFATAALKGHQLISEPVAGTSLLSSRWFLIAVVECEFAFALWLFAGCFPKATWRATVGWFVLLACVALYRALSGAASCGCFGKITVSPWLILGVDLSCLAALWWYRPNQLVNTARMVERLDHPRLERAAAAGVIFLFLGVPAGWVMATFESTRIAADGSLLGNGRIVVLEPETWAGKPFPLEKYIDIGGQLARGRWKVVLYHHDCPQCQALLAQYATSSATSIGDTNTGSIAAIEMPPFATAPRSPSTLAPFLVYGKLSTEKEWFATTPCEIELDDGRVIRVLDGAGHD